MMCGMSEFVPPTSEELAAASLFQRAGALLVEITPMDCPVVHRFTPGLYIREWHGPANSMGLTMRHKTEHPFILSKGKVMLVMETGEKVFYEAPFCGITKPGTQRLMYCLEDTIWTTFHVTNETDVEKIILEITDFPENPLIDPTHPNLNQWRRELPKNIQ